MKTRGKEKESHEQKRIYYGSLGRSEEKKKEDIARDKRKKEKKKLEERMLRVRLLLTQQKVEKLRMSMKNWTKGIPSLPAECSGPQELPENGTKI